LTVDSRTGIISRLFSRQVVLSKIAKTGNKGKWNDRDEDTGYLMLDT
jgi:hypothetical protein